MKIVYSYYVLDIVHKGHINMMRSAKKIAGKDGISIVAILTDKATMEKKDAPIFSFNERFEIAKAIKYADIVVAQDTYSPLPNVMKMRPNVLMEKHKSWKLWVEAIELMKSLEVQFCFFIKNRNLPIKFVVKPLI